MNKEFEYKVGRGRWTRRVSPRVGCGPAQRERTAQIQSSRSAALCRRVLDTPDVRTALNPVEEACHELVEWFYPSMVESMSCGLQEQTAGIEA